jgi:hypothetical protein
MKKIIKEHEVNPEKSVRGLAKKYMGNRKSLRARINGEPLIKAGLGRNTIVSKEEEKQLVEHLANCFRRKQNSVFKVFTDYNPFI